MSTKIEWCDETIQPVVGCTKVSEACTNCYAEKMAKRLCLMGSLKNQARYDTVISAGGHWNGMVHLDLSEMDKVAKWRKSRRIFVVSMGDLFHESVPLDFILQVFDRMEQAKQHTFMVLTKRPERMLKFCGNYGIGEAFGVGWPENIWAGCTAENQSRADERIPILLQIPAAKHFISYEPALGPIRFDPYFRCGGCGYTPKDKAELMDHRYCTNKTNTLSWVVMGGETGPNARPMHPDWARSVRDQCQTAGVPFLFKSWGEFADLTDDEPGSLNHKSSTHDEIFTVSGERLGTGYRIGRESNGMVEPEWREKGARWMGRIGKKATGPPAGWADLGGVSRGGDMLLTESRKKLDDAIQAYGNACYLADEAGMDIKGKEIPVLIDALVAGGDMLTETELKEIEEDNMIRLCGDCRKLIAEIRSLRHDNSEMNSLLSDISERLTFPDGLLPDHEIGPTISEIRQGLYKARVEIISLRAENEALRKEGKWRPLMDIPPLENVFIVLLPGNRVAMAYRAKNGTIRSELGHIDYTNEVKGWWPLPLPPPPGGDDD